MHSLVVECRMWDTAVTLSVSVDGGWSEWVESGRTECSKTCGTGSQTITETRTCTNPPPSGPGARPCLGDNSRTSSAYCNTEACAGEGHVIKFSVSCTVLSYASLNHVPVNILSEPMLDDLCHSQKTKICLGKYMWASALCPSFYVNPAPVIISMKFH